MSELSFRALFFRHYDRTIAAGITTFSQTGIRKNDFTKLCMDADFVLDDESISRAANAMRLTPEQKAELFSAAKRDRKDDK